MVFRADFLKSKRILFGMSLRVFADKIGTVASQVSRWETGKTVPHPRQLKKIAKALKCHTEDLYQVAIKEPAVKSKSEARNAEASTTSTSN